MRSHHCSTAAPLRWPSPSFHLATCSERRGGTRRSPNSFRYSSPPLTSPLNHGRRVGRRLLLGSAAGRKTKAKRTSRKTAGSLMVAPSPNRSSAISRRSLRRLGSGLDCADLRDELFELAL